MAILSRKITAFLKKVADLPDRPGGTVTTSALKAQFDSSPEELRVSLNGLIDDLASTAAGASGAHQLGSETIAGVAGNNVHAQLYDMKAQINQAAIGQIPPGSITPTELSFVPVKSTDYTALDVLAKLLTVDGVSSGIDAATVCGFKFQVVNGAVQYDDGTGWKPVGGGGTYVASNTIQESQTTEYQLDSTNYKLVYKFVPKFTGEVIVQADIRGVQTGPTPSQAVDTAPLSLKLLSGVEMYDQTVAAKTATSPLDYRTPLGTVVGGTGSTLVFDSDDTALYSTKTAVLKVFSQQPIYFVINCADTHYQGLDANKGKIKNIQIKYDVVRG